MIDIVTPWIRERESRQFHLGDLRKFVEAMNNRSRALIAELQNTNPMYWQELGRLAEDAETYAREGERCTLDPFRTILARKFMKPFEMTDPKFYSALMELSIHAVSLVTPGARIIADGVDRTNV